MTDDDEVTPTEDIVREREAEEEKVNGSGAHYSPTLAKGAIETLGARSAQQVKELQELFVGVKNVATGNTPYQRGIEKNLKSVTDKLEDVCELAERSLQQSIATRNAVRIFNAFAVPLTHLALVAVGGGIVSGLTIELARAILHR